MAEHRLETRILLRYATYVQWMNSDVILKEGEMAVATFPGVNTIEGASNSAPYGTPPAVGLKIGDGRRYFYQLPWVQAIAADVYDWAKATDPPQANTIPGLNDYIANYLDEHGGGSGGGSGTSVARQYQIVRGTASNANRYYLRYKNDDSTTWTTDTNHYIDVDKYEKLVAWVGKDLDELPNLRTMTGLQFLEILSSLGFTDTPVEGQFVVAINEENGIISVQRAAPMFSHLLGHASVAQGGTGLTTLPYGEVLIGNEDRAITSLPIATEIANNNYLVPNYLVKAYVDNATAGLTGAMHYIGEATVEITGAVDPRIPDYVFAHARPGDVITQGFKEYVWTGYSWQLMGDEGSYAVKGSIKDIDIDSEANIQQSKISGLIEALALKVSIEEGKGLSSNDYTNEDKAKLTGIEEGAQRNLIEHIFLNNTEVYPTTINGLEKSLNLSVNIFTDADRTKLDSIDMGAQVNTIEAITVNGVAQPIDTSKTVNLLIDEFTKVYKDKLDTIEEYAKPNVIESIYLNNTQLIPTSEKRVDINLLTVTQAQLDKLNALPIDANANIIESISLNSVEQPIVNKNVNLIINEFTTAYEEKLNSIQTGAQVNNIERIIVNRKEYTPVNKVITININESTLELNVLTGAIVPDENNFAEDVDVTDNHKLLLARVAKTGNIKDLKQTADTFVTLNCGTSKNI